MRNINFLKLQNREIFHRYLCAGDYSTFGKVVYRRAILKE